MHFEDFKLHISDVKYNKISAFSFFLNIKRMMSENIRSFCLSMLFYENYCQVYLASPE